MIFAVCAGYQIVGRSFPGAEGIETGLELLDVTTTVGAGPRAVGELLIEPDPSLDLPLVSGFENHQGVTALGPDARPLGRVLRGRRQRRWSRAPHRGRARRTGRRHVRPRAGAGPQPGVRRLAAGDDRRARSTRSNTTSLRQPPSCAANGSAQPGHGRQEPTESGTLNAWKHSICGSPLTEMSTTAPGYAAPTVVARGNCKSRMMSPREFSLWSLTAELDAGVELEWNATHGDEAVYVKKGSLTIDGRTCPADGTLILEAGVPAIVRADEPTTVVHFGPWDPNPPTTGAYGAPAEEGRTVHVVGPGGTYSLIQPGRASKFYADSTFPTSRITLLYTSREDAVPVVAAQPLRRRDHLLAVGRDPSGSDHLEVGRRDRHRRRPSLPLQGRREGFGFLNYRRDASYMSVEKDKPPFLEGGALHDFNKVMDLR